MVPVEGGWKMIKNKTCPKCEKVKDLTEFSKHRQRKDGVQSYCKQCAKQWRQDNRERILERKKQWRQDNRERILERQKQYYQDNREARLEYGKQWRQDNPEYGKQWRQDNRERISEYVKQYKATVQKERLKNDEQFRIRQYLSSNLRQCLKRVEKVKKSSILKYIGCSMEDLQNHLNSTKQPEWGDDVHIDHIIPSSLFDHTNEEEIKKCWHWRNLRYLPSIYNKSKGNTLDLDLIRSYNIEDLLPEGTDV